MFQRKPIACLFWTLRLLTLLSTKHGPLASTPLYGRRYGIFSDRSKQYRQIVPYVVYRRKHKGAFSCSDKQAVVDLISTARSISPRNQNKYQIVLFKYYWKTAMDLTRWPLENCSRLIEVI